MRLAGHQPDYLPYLGFFARMYEVDLFLYVDHVQFEKKSWQSRNRIRGKDGSLLLSVPVVTAGRHTQGIASTEISNLSGTWRRKHWKSIVGNYKKAPYFTHHSDFFETLFAKDWRFLVDLNLTIIQYVRSYLGIEVPVERTSVRIWCGKKTDLLVELCRHYGADEYVSGEGGRQYVDDQILLSNGIASSYTSFHHPIYRQLYNPFVPNMSIIDALFNEGRRTKDILIGSVNSNGGRRT